MPHQVTGVALRGAEAAGKLTLVV